MQRIARRLMLATAATLGLASATASAPAFASSCPPSGTGYSATIAATAGVVGYWRLGDAVGTTTTCDSVGADFGTYAGGFTLGRPGALAGDADTAVSFDGSTGYASIPASTALNVGDDFTIEAWVKRGTVGGTASQAIASKQGGAWVLMLNPSNQLVLRRAKVADVVASTTTIADTTTWHYVAATKNGSAVHLYVDGRDVTGTVSDQTMADNTSPLVIGQSSGVAFFDGTVDEVTLYDTALSASQVSSHYSAGVTSSSGSTTSSDPVIAAAGDIACDPADKYFNKGAGRSNHCMQRATAALVVDTGLTGILTLGDDQYDDGAYSKFQQVYSSTWGKANDLGHPAVGNHEYLTPDASGYFDYFDGLGALDGIAGRRGEGWYSFDIGTWHIVDLNSNCLDISGGCGYGSPEEQWLASDLAAHPARCTLAFWHHPRFGDGTAGNDTDVSAWWHDLYNAGADVVLNGHEHDYERFAPQTPIGTGDTLQGIREFVVGTGGKSQTAFSTAMATSQVRHTGTYGVLRLTLHPTSYDWKFVPIAGQTFTDSGSQACH